MYSLCPLYARQLFLFFFFLFFFLTDILAATACAIASPSIAGMVYARCYMLFAWYQWIPTIYSVLGRATARQPNIRKIVQSSLYSWTMYIIIKIRCCHLMVNSLATRWHNTWNSTSSFSIWPFLHSYIFGHSCLCLLISPSVIDIHQLFLLDCVGLYL